MNIQNQIKSGGLTALNLTPHTNIIISNGYTFYDHKTLIQTPIKQVHNVVKPNLTKKTHQMKR